jgi:hypothetical protein
MTLGITTRIGEGIEMAGEVLLTISRDEMERMRLETARSLREMGLGPEQIQRALKLSPEEIAAL